MELVKMENDTAVTELRVVSEYFNKLHRHLMRDIRQIITDLPLLSTEFIPYTYEDVQGKERPTYLLTQKGFSILVMGFKGKKALELKSKFYDAFEQLKKETKDLRLLLTNILTPDLNVSPQVVSPRILTTNSIINHIEQLRKENYIKERLINEYEKCTYCISDICCKFKNLNPVQANLFLLGKGVIEKRASGYYPSLDYLDWCISATTYDFNNYVRYTPKGMEEITNMLVNNGFELKEV